MGPIPDPLSIGSEPNRIEKKERQIIIVIN